MGDTDALRRYFRSFVGMRLADGYHKEGEGRSQCTMGHGDRQEVEEIAAGREQQWRM